MGENPLHDMYKNKRNKTKLKYLYIHLKYY